MRSVGSRGVRSAPVSLFLLILIAAGCASTAETTAETTTAPTAAQTSPTSTLASAPTTLPTEGGATSEPLESGATSEPPQNLAVHDELRGDLEAVFSDWFATSSAPGASMAVELSDGAVLLSLIHI